MWPTYREPRRFRSKDRGADPRWVVPIQGEGESVAPDRHGAEPPLKGRAVESLVGAEQVDVELDPGEGRQQRHVVREQPRDRAARWA